MPAAKLAELLIGGIAILDLPKSERSAMLAEALRRDSFHPAADAQHAVSARPVLLDL